MSAPPMMRGPGPGGPGGPPGNSNPAAAFLNLPLNSLEPDLVRITAPQPKPRKRKKPTQQSILALESKLTAVKDPFFKKALQLLVDGVEASVARSALETETDAEFEENA